MTTNLGRAIYIVYSMLTIPIMTILVSLMSDAILSKFQKAAERFGVRPEDKDVEGRLAGDRIEEEEILEEVQDIEQVANEQLQNVEQNAEGEPAREPEVNKTDVERILQETRKKE